MLFAGGHIRIWSTTAAHYRSEQTDLQSTALVDPIELSYGPKNALYVFDRKLNAIAVYDSSLRLSHRTIVPLDLAYVRQMAVTPEGTIHLAAYATEHPGSQVHVLCPAVGCYVRSSGSDRKTRDTLVHSFFQSGYIALDDELVILAHVNPFWIETIEPHSGRTTTLVQSDELEDGEHLAVRYRDSRAGVINRFPQVTGIVRDQQGDLLISAFAPDSVRSVLLLYSSSGDLISKAYVPGFFAVKDIVPGGDILVLRQLGRQELVRYRVEVATDSR